jgi:hypothetical protein
MQVFDIKNSELMELLERFRYLYLEKYDVPNINKLGPEPTNSIGQIHKDVKGPVDEYFVSTEFRDIIIDKGRDHDGYPDSARSWPLKPEHYFGDDVVGYNRDYYDLESRMRILLGIHQCALSHLYPPKGYISWHNNANAPAYNLIFTWSETGDGWFKYMDKYGREFTIKDKKGWSLKAGYFGTYDEGRVCYHAAHTECWRMTQSYIVTRHERDYWKDCIEFITES